MTVNDTCPSPLPSVLAQSQMEGTRAGCLEATGKRKESFEIHVAASSDLEVNERPYRLPSASSEPPQVNRLTTPDTCRHSDGLSFPS